MKKVSILGCGWVGQALKEKLDGDYDVLCLSRDIEANAKAQMYVCDVLVIAIPQRDNYMEVLRETLEYINSNTQVILLSSISFYDGKALVVEAEALVLKLYVQAVILRLGGLMGYERIAGKYTAGKVMTGDSQTNYVHRDDVLGIIESIVMQEVDCEIFDVIAPIQSTKKKIFSQNAKNLRFTETEFLNGDKVGKVFFPTKVYETLGYSFLREDVHRFWD